MPRRLFLDIGGEGRHSRAWNVNRRRLRSGGPRRGQPIPRLILARGEALPLADHAADRVLVERTPLRNRLVDELARVTRPGGTIVLRHLAAHGRDPHARIGGRLPGRMRRRVICLGGQVVHETAVRLPAGPRAAR